MLHQYNGMGENNDLLFISLLQFSNFVVYLLSVRFCNLNQCNLLEVVRGTDIKTINQIYPHIASSY